jgi:hypothetical protein
MCRDPFKAFLVLRMEAEARAFCPGLAQMVMPSSLELE